MSTENSNNLRTDGELPEINFFIHVDQHGMKSGFEPKNKVTGAEVLLCLSLGIRGICVLLAEKIDMSLDEVIGGLQHGLDAALSEDFEDKLGYDGYDIN